MYKIIKIGNEEYKLEYNIEASLYADCISALTDMMTGIGYASQSNNGESVKENIKEFLHTIANVPQTALTIFYAGLMEAHGTHKRGDGRVPDMDTAKDLIATYIRETEGVDGFYDVMGTCIEQMDENGFFKLTGLEKMLTDMGMAEQKKPRKAPADHKRKSTKVTEMPS